MPSLFLIRKSWIVFVYATTIAAESIIVEYLTTSFLRFSPFMLSAISITSAGIMLLLIANFIFKKKEEIKNLFIKSLKILILASLSLSFGILTWYDSINRIGASKEALIAGPFEIVMIVVLARVFLKERLHRLQVVGTCMALIGVFMALASGDHDTANGDYLEKIKTTTKSEPISFSFLSATTSLGDIEAILSAFGFAIGVIFLSKLILRYSAIEVAATSMFTSGLILFSFIFLVFVINSDSGGLRWASNGSHLIVINIVTLFLFSLLPFIGSLSYSTGLSRIGPSLTATIGSSNILITVIIQIILKELGYPSHLPENIQLAILGGVIGFIGIYVIHIPNYSLAMNGE